MHRLDFRLHVGQGTHRGPLTLFPVWTGVPSRATDYLTGAMASVDVAERAGSPVVSELIVTNRSDLPVLLLAGELIEGGWQQRALAATTLLPPARPTVQRVVCVEEGRWHGEVDHYRRSRRVPSALLPHLDGEDAQERVWHRIRCYDDVVGTSATGALGDRLDHTASMADELTHGMRPLAGQCGLVIGVGGKPAALEVFDSPRALAAHWPSVLHAATLDGLGRAAIRTPGALARSFAERVEKASLISDGPAGLGRRFVARGRVRVDMLRWRHRCIHLSAVDVPHPLQEAE